MNAKTPAGPATDVPVAVRDAIARLMTEYANAIDNDELERWPHFFTEQCLYQILPRPDYRQGRPIGIWFCDNRDMLEDRVSSIREVNVYEPHVYRHVISPAEITGMNNGAWTAQTSYIVVRTMHDGAMQVFSAGRYVDEIEVDGAIARFRKRIVVPDSPRFDTLVVIPL
ncbi:MAG: aromatic-ring-hydroxylating dioxygenase subunit beta [Burkholderiales bacterium]|nr:aromatic-ring-hydroxylating dioxygenase subunit beta [Burkholderiales bacterium]